MLDFVINPIAGGKHGKKIKKVIEQIKEYLSLRKKEFKLYFTEGKGGATALTRSLIENGATDIVCVGGDGTLHEVINGFSNFEKVNLGLIPCGTGNDFAHAVKIPKDVNKALDLILDGEAKPTDYMQMPTVRGMNVIGMGIDVDVLKRYESLKKKTKFGYTKSLIKTLFNFEYTDFDLDLDGVNKKYRSFLVCFANGCVYGGGIPVCPLASPTDGIMNFVTIKEMKRFKIIGAFLKLKAGKILSHPLAEHYECENIKLNVKPPYTVNVDGELYNDIPFEIRIVSNKLKMYRP